MKTYFIILFSLLVSAFAAPTAQADNYNDGWTFYGSNNYRGSNKMMNAGEYDNCSNWRYYSWKAERNCCIIFYYYKKNGQKGERKVCGDMRDFKAEMRKWGSLKYGWNQPWKNIYKAVFACGGGGDSHANNNHNNGNHNNNHNNNNGGGGDWKTHFNQGKCVVWERDNYRDNFIFYSRDKKYYPKDLKWKFYSCRVPKNYELYFYVRQRNGQKKGFTVRGDVTRMNDYFGKWNVQDRNRGWNFVEYFIMRKVGSGGGGNQQANNNNNNGNSGGGGDWRTHFNQGKCVVWERDNYRDNFIFYSRDKKYYPKDLKWKFYSCRVPKNYELYFYVRQRNGQKKGFTVRGDVMRMNDYFGKWNVQDRNRGWNFVEYFIMRKVGSGGGNNNGHENNNMDYSNKEWFKKFGRGGYITFFQYRNFDGRYYGKPAGNYDPRRLVYPQSIYMKGTSKYLVLGYLDKRNRKESIVIKESIHDLGKYLYNLGVHDKYKNEPYKAITSLTVMNQ